MGGFEFVVVDMDICPAEACSTYFKFDLDREQVPGYLQTSVFPTSGATLITAPIEFLDSQDTSPCIYGD